MKPLAHIDIKVKGRLWKFMLLTDRSYNKLHNPNGESSNAMTIPSRYEVHFPKSSWNIVDIRHELSHCFYSMSAVNSSDLTPDQVEETMCSIFGYHAPEMVMLADRVAECFFNYK